MTGMPRETPQQRKAFVKRAATGHRRCCCKSPDLAALRQPRSTVCVPAIPFSLVYILRGDDIEIVAVAHGRRRPSYWRSRL